MKPQKKLFNQVTVLGVGLIGGSIGRILKKKRLCTKIIGVGRSVSNLRYAQRHHIIDQFTSDLKRGTQKSDLVIVALPVKSIVPVIRKIAEFLPDGAIVTDVGSIKYPIVEKTEKYIPDRIHFVGGHPIAGTEKSGAAASFPELFMKRYCILTPTEKTDQTALNKVKRLWKSAGSKVVVMDAKTHDYLIASISHLPHVVAYALVNSVAQSPSGKKNMAFSAGGFRDFTRIAASDAALWREIIEMNKEQLLPFLDLFIRIVKEYRSYISKSDFSRLQSEFQKARRIREYL